MINTHHRAVFDVLYDYRREHDTTPTMLQLVNLTRLSTVTIEDALKRLAYCGFIHKRIRGGKLTVQILRIPQADVDYVPDWRHTRRAA